MKKFTVWQLFSIVDGRMSTSVDDIYDILDTASGTSLMTHNLPTAADYFRKTKPEWYKKAETSIGNLKTSLGDTWNDWSTVENYFKNADSRANYEIEVQTIPESEKAQFRAFMLSNSLI
jgi:hypothetical protein